MQLPCLQAPAAWQRIDFISDLHLDASEPATFEAWAEHMAHTPADALFILGDLFEVWVGDDNPDPFAQRCASVLKATAQRMPVYFMCGNRDFLVGHDWLQATGIHGLSDPTVLDLGTQTTGAQPLRFVLSHGDALCLADHDYLAFRTQVRAPAWQAQFLAKPLAERQTYARQVRQQSEARKHRQASYADVDTNAALGLLQESKAQVMVHGHTHRPAQHVLASGLTRWVLSDWDAQAEPPRLEVLCWQRQQAQSPTRGLCRLSLAHA